MRQILIHYGGVLKTQKNIFCNASEVSDVVPPTEQMNIASCNGYATSVL